MSILLIALQSLANIKPNTPQKQGLPAGVVVGIVIGSILGIVTISCVVLFLLNKKGVINIPFLNKKNKEDEESNK